jgi:hypothetical protein
MEKPAPSAKKSGHRHASLVQRFCIGLQLECEGGSFALALHMHSYRFRLQTLFGWPVTLCVYVAWFILLMASRAVADTGRAVPSPPPETTELNVGDPSPDFNGPVNPRLWFSLEDEASLSYSGLSGSSSQLNFRIQVPMGKFIQHPVLWPRRLQILRLKLPVVTSAPSRAVKGNGDTTLLGLQYLGVKERQWLVGPAFKIPTASVNDLGAGKWSVGPAAGYTYLHGRTSIGLFTQSFFSFAGPKSRPPFAQTQLQPGLFFSFPSGWIIGTSQMQFTYNWYRGQWTVIPLGVRIARDIETEKRRLSSGFEAEKNLIHVDGTPGWTLRLSFRYQFSKF